MRREDKYKLPPRLKLKLPAGYHVERSIEGYQLYLRQPFGIFGTTTTLVAAFFRDTAPGEMEDYALSHSLHELI